MRGGRLCHSRLCLVAQWSPAPCNPMDCSPPGCSVHGIPQARILEWVAIPASRGSSQPRDRTQISHIAGRFFTVWALECWVINTDGAEARGSWEGGTLTQIEEGVGVWRMPHLFGVLKMSKSWPGWDLRRSFWGGEAHLVRRCASRGWVEDERSTVGHNWSDLAAAAAAEGRRAGPAFWQVTGCPGWEWLYFLQLQTNTQMSRHEGSEVPGWPQSLDGTGLHLPSWMTAVPPPQPFLSTRFRDAE